jgi:predicted esterase YcpF (UPF0227 family)
MVVLSREDEIRDNHETADALSDYYDVTWDETQTHKFKKISQHLQAMKAFKNA